MRVVGQSKTRGTHEHTVLQSFENDKEAMKMEIDFDNQARSMELEFYYDSGKF